MAVIKAKLQEFCPKPDALKRMIEIAPASGPGSIQAMREMARDTIRDAPKYVKGRKLKLRIAEAQETLEKLRLKKP